MAVIDSGIAPVPDLEERITAFYDFTGGQGAVASSPVDGYGHGTHVAGIAAGALAGFLLRVLAEVVQIIVDLLLPR